MSTTHAPTGQDIERHNRHAIRNDIDQVRDDVKQVKDDVGQCATDIAHAGAEAVQHGADATLEAGRKAAENAGEVHKALCRHVAEHPTSSILIAMGVGALLARVVPRS